MFRQDPSTYGVPNLAADIMESAAPTPAAAPDRVGALEAAVLYLQQRAARLEYRVAELERDQKTRALPSEQDVYLSQEGLRQQLSSQSIAAQLERQAINEACQQHAQQFTADQRQNTFSARLPASDARPGQVWASDGVTAGWVTPTPQAQAALQGAHSSSTWEKHWKDFQWSGASEQS